ncbi:FAD binding domain-containing protein [Nonomuraea sp. SMC257]|uniref:FAD binding domain-containing protein n=1 Tax=Nonomuraea montanisoli TaxID=2741721 RepID=A0A7Y6I3H7_9ACTN|nr:FAD binding domain-containing protein [Nonomuraea montanisoli]NUW31035.1 FAD binding domain-containing protein [Nonomuraea montanisoli]
MKPPPFTYHAPRDLREALDLLAEVDGKVLAGGQSLIPLLNMRLAAPAHVVDVNRLPGLSGIEAGPGGVTVGALARQAEVARAGVHPLLGQALRLVAHPVIRNRGTVVGSLVHADPAAELPAVLAVLGGSVRLARRAPGGSSGPAAGRGGSPSPGAVPGGSPGPVVREVAADAFFAGPLESAAEPGELAVSAFFPALPPRSGSAFEELARRHGDYALAGVCAVVTLDEDLHVAAARVACVGVGPVPVVADVSEACGRRPAATVPWEAVVAAVRRAVEPEDDIHASAAYRLHLVGVLAERALREAAARAAAPP